MRDKHHNTRGHTHLKTKTRVSFFHASRTRDQTNKQSNTTCNPMPIPRMICRAILGAALDLVIALNERRAENPHPTQVAGPAHSRSCFWQPDVMGPDRYKFLSSKLLSQGTK